MLNTFIGKLGIVFIILGVIGAIGIIFSFDWEAWNDAKDFPLIHSEELTLLKPQLMTTWIYAGVALLGNLAIGSVLMALDKIINILESK